MTGIKLIEGGVCAAQGFTGAGIHCGVRKNRTKRDLALILSSVPASAAAVYTTNLVKGAPLEVTKKHLENGLARAVICNSGNANTCNADGIEIAEATCALLASELGIAPEDVVVASTGVIGQRLSLEPFKTGIPELCKALGPNSHDVGEAIMTTDCAVSPEMLQKALSTDVQETFNMVSVDGDTSTNDMVAILANGLAGNAEIASEGEDFENFMRALNTVTVHLCRCIAGDGEGATKLLECRVTGALDKAAAKTAARGVICSSLLKAAMFGADANWGRVLCAIGYSGAKVDIGKVGVAFRSRAGTVRVCEMGAGIPFSEEEAKAVLSEDEIEILVSLGDGVASATAWGCDLTYDYVKINGDYRT